MNRIRVLVTLLVAVVGAVGGAVVAAPRPIPQPPAAALSGAFAEPVSPVVTVRETAGGRLAGAVLAGMGAPVREILAGAGNSLDAVRADDTFTTDTFTGDERPFRIRLFHDPAATSELLWNGKKYVPRKMPIPYVIQPMSAAVTVTSSLWAAAARVGFSAQQIGGLAKIFEYDVDFNTEMVEGARFRLVLDRLTADDGARTVGDIRAAILDNGKDSFTAIRYRLSDGSVGWYAADGTARKKAFLRSPLEFSRVTSGFTTGRYHPILHKMRAHKGVDLAAPTGTDVRAAADGVVTKAGWAGGHGNHVELRHAGGISTGYSHLSKISVKAGATVHQGQVIGKVGTTGLSTGPHLHYEFLVNGVNKDPMKTIVPIVQPLPEGEKAAFFAARDAILPTLTNAEELTDAKEDVPTDSTTGTHDR